MHLLLDDDYTYQPSTLNIPVDTITLHLTLIQVSVATCILMLMVGSSCDCMEVSEAMLHVLAPLLTPL